MRGAVLAVGADASKTVVFDLGGGSTEFVLGTEEGVQAARSVNIGCVRLTERHMASAPATSDQIQRVEADTDAAIDTVLQSVPLERLPEPLPLPVLQPRSPPRHWG